MLSRALPGIGVLLCSDISDVCISTPLIPTRASPLRERDPFKGKLHLVHAKYLTGKSLAGGTSPFFFNVAAGTVSLLYFLVSLVLILKSLPMYQIVSEDPYHSDASEQRAYFCTGMKSRAVLRFRDSCWLLIFFFSFLFGLWCVLNQLQISCLKMHWLSHFCQMWRKRKKKTC